MLISVALCTYNGANYLSQQLESIFQQSYPVQEIVVCDDGSTDNTIPILKDFAAQHPGILHLYQNTHNLGGRKNFEQCYNRCNGDVIFFCDQDDLWHPEKVAKTLQHFDANPDCWAIASDAVLIDEAGNPLGANFWQELGFNLEDVIKFSHNKLWEFIISYHNVVAGAMLAIKKEAKPFILPFHFPYDIWHDEWITVALSVMDKIKLVPDTLVSYRIHSGQQMGIGKVDQEGASYLEKIKSREKLLADPVVYLYHAWHTYDKQRQLATKLPALDLSALQAPLCKQLQDAKKTFLRTQSWPMRKARLIKWLLFREFATNLKDVATL